jgi:hypothetical protein
MIGSISADWPKIWTTMIALVRFVMTGAIVSADSVYVVASISANTGTALKTSAAVADAIMV